MLLSFYRYFISFIFLNRRREWPLFLALLGLIVSASSLLVLQSVMSGLQNNQIIRAKAVEGSGVVSIHDGSVSLANSLKKDLESIGLDSFLEYETELLIQIDGLVRPVVLHGVSGSPSFLQDKDVSGAVLPSILAYRMGIAIGDDVTLVSPAHYNHFLQEIPRSVTVEVSDFIDTGVPEIDDFHLWVRLPTAQNLIRSREVNRVRIYGDSAKVDGVRAMLEGKYSGKMSFNSWSQRNQTMLWSLELEHKVMTFLFVAMSLLVGLSITGGLSLLYGKLKGDLAAFWALGASYHRLEMANLYLCNAISFLASFVGLILGFVILYFLDIYGDNFFSSDFVDRKIPINVTWQGVAISFLTPYFIGLLFSYYSFKQFKSEANHLRQVRLVGA